jgi:hypothetical protein
MKIHTFWQIIIKALGIYLMFQFVAIAPQLFVNIFQVLLLRTEESGMLLQAVVTIVTILLYGSIMWYAIFRTDRLISKLNLATHIDEDMLDLNISKTAILNMAIIVVGGVTFIEALPMFCHQLFLYFIDINTYDGFKRSPYSSLLIDGGLKLLIGYLLISFHQPVVKFILQRTN